MNRSVRNPTKRNRNIGTSKQGHGLDNELSIPQPSDTLKFFYERFIEAETSTISVHDRELPVVVEKLKEGFFYSCTPADAELVLNQLPEEDLEGFGLLIFRQPKKKEQILSSVWGRLIYSVEFKDDYLPSIILEATPNYKKFTFPKKQTPDLKREFELLKTDGLIFTSSKREYVAEISKEKTRSIQLYRTLLHEVGHYVHYLEVVERPGSDEEEYEEWEKRSDLYFRIPAQEKEVYANTYAVKAKQNLLNKKIIPFERIE